MTEPKGDTRELKLHIEELEERIAPSIIPPNCISVTAGEGQPLFGNICFTDGSAPPEVSVVLPDGTTIRPTPTP